MEAVTLRAAATIENDPPTVLGAASGDDDPERGTRAVPFSRGEAVETTVLDRDALTVGTWGSGPAVLAGGESTTVVPPGWSWRVRADGTVVLLQAGGRS